MKKISDIYASIGTIVVSIIVLLILFFCGISTSRDPIDEGLMVVSYGDVDDGYGTPEEPQTQPDEAASAQEQPQTATPPPTPQPAQPLLTQEDKSVALAPTEKARKAAEQQAKTDKANALASAFRQKTDKDSGTTTDEAMQKNPADSGVSNGNGWSLKGRALQGGLPKPDYSGDEQGRVVVKIRVDRDGFVTEAIVDPTVSNITNKKLLDASVAAAKKTRFTAGDNIAMGTITYNFSTK